MATPLRTRDELMNLYAYDAAGELIGVTRLYRVEGRGRHLCLVAEDGSEQSYPLVPGRSLLLMRGIDGEHQP